MQIPDVFQLLCLRVYLKQALIIISIISHIKISVNFQSKILDTNSNFPIQMMCSEYACEYFNRKRLFYMHVHTF